MNYVYQKSHDITLYMHTGSDLSIYVDIQTDRQTDRQTGKKNE